MSLIVMKFGGSSVADKERLENVADIIAAERRKGNDVLAVVSAQGDTTDELIEKALEIAPEPDKRELDALISVGEQMTAALLTMVLKKRNISAVSLTGAQAGIKATDAYGDGDVLTVDGSRVKAELAEGKTVILAGFQGVTESGDVVTLGRGGSDTTAVFMASQLGAEQCRIYKDVDGVYDHDPRKNSDAVRYPVISYTDMLALADSGAQVLHKKCVLLAEKYGLEIIVLSSFEKGGGTIVKAG